MVHLPYTAYSQNILSNPGPGSKVIKYKSVLLSMQKQPNKNAKSYPGALEHQTTYSESKIHW